MDLRSKRKRQLLTQDQLAAKVNIPQSQLSRIESGLVNPSPKTKTKIEKILGSITWKDEEDFKLKYDHVAEQTETNGRITTWFYNTEGGKRVLKKKTVEHDGEIDSYEYGRDGSVQRNTKLTVTKDRTKIQTEEKTTMKNNPREIFNSSKGDKGLRAPEPRWKNGQADFSHLDDTEDPFFDNEDEEVDFQEKFDSKDELMSVPPPKLNKQGKIVY
jgi:transcriptional regulator with XRE-family HTH domain